MVNVTNLLAKAGSGVGFSFGVKFWTEMEIWCINSMYRLKLIASEKNSWFNSLTTIGYLLDVLIKLWIPSMVRIFTSGWS